MDTNTNTPAQQAPVAAPGIFGTSLPSIATLATGVLLFLLPFIDIKCNDVSLKTVSGFELATGFSIDKNGSSPLSNGESTGTKEKKEGNIYAILALAMGVVALGLSFTNAKAAIGVSMITAAGAAVALIGLMIDIKGQMKTNPVNSSASGDDPLGMNKMAENINVRVEFTPWFYIAVIAFLVSAYFCFRRIQASRT